MILAKDRPRPRTRHGQEARLQELRRLQFLERMGLAEKVGTRTWRLSPMLEPALRQAQLAGDIIKSRARHVSQLSDARLPLVVTTLAPGARVTGRVVGTGLADELHDRRYLLLEGSDRRRHYIWAVGNRVICDLIHRGVQPQQLTAADRDDNFWGSVPTVAERSDEHATYTASSPRTTGSHRRSRSTPV